jgi:hypothetical protein
LAPRLINGEKVVGCLHVPHNRSISDKTVVSYLYHISGDNEPIITTFGEWNKYPLVLPEGLYEIESHPTDLPPDDDSLIKLTKNRQAENN